MLSKRQMKWKVEGASYTSLLPRLQTTFFYLDSIWIRPSSRWCCVRVLSFLFTCTYSVFYGNFRFICGHSCGSALPREQLLTPALQRCRCLCSSAGLSFCQIFCGRSDGCDESARSLKWMEKKRTVLEAHRAFELLWSFLILSLWGPWIICFALNISLHLLQEGWQGTGLQVFDPA